MGNIVIFIVSSIFTGLFAVLIFIIVSNYVPVNKRLELFGIVNKWVVLSFFLYTFGFLKHEIGYYLTVDSNYCKQTDICDKLMRQTKPSIIDNIHGYLSFIQNVWVESVGEGLVFVFVGLPTFLFFKNKLIAAFFTGILANLVAEYSGIHDYFCKTSCNLNPLPPII
jgi:hypothetical protein